MEQNRWDPPARSEREPEPEPKPRRYEPPQRDQSAEWDEPSPRYDDRYGESRRTPRPSRLNDDPWAED
jgi:hypothetical protein